MWKIFGHLGTLELVPELSAPTASHDLSRWRNWSAASVLYLEETEVFHTTKLTDCVVRHQT